jgi:hypothetical protein
MKVSYLNDAFFGRLETLALELRTNLRGYFGGKHLVNTYGQTVEFADFREYRQGDDIRRIDWNLYSRFEKYFLKLFTDERQMKIQIFLDCSASMGKDNPEKAAYALATAAAMGYLAVHNMDKVSFNRMVGDKAINEYGTIVGKSAYFRMIADLENLQFADDVNVEKCITGCPNTGTGNGLSVIISDFFTDDEGWKKAVDYLCFKKQQVLLVQIMSPEEIDPSYDGRVNLIDAESEDITDRRNMRIRITREMQRAYQVALKGFQEEIKTFCAKRGAQYVTLRTDVPIEKALLGSLLNAGIMS